MTSIRLLVRAFCISSLVLLAGCGGGEEEPARQCWESTATGPFGGIVALGIAQIDVPQTVALDVEMTATVRATDSARTLLLRGLVVADGVAPPAATVNAGQSSQVRVSWSGKADSGGISLGTWGLGAESSVTDVRLRACER